MINKVTRTCKGFGAVLSQSSSVPLSRTFASKLMEVGHLDVPNTTDSYKAGQLFLHRLFGYRGVILLPWSAQVFDKDKSTKSEADVNINNTNINKDDNTIIGEAYKEDDNTKTYPIAFYNVLIDNRDHPFLWAHTSSFTLLRHSDDHTISDMYTIPGLDYAAHQDVLPYTPSPGEDQPLQHQLVDHFLTYRPGHELPFIPSEILQLWQQKNRNWLEVSEVYRETTEKIRVTVVPFFMGRLESFSGDEFWWRYWICLENTGELAVRLRERYWRIFSEAGTLDTVRGRGVLGHEPLLSPGLPAFQYSSHVCLQAPLGHMWGSLRMEREDGYSFDCKIPKFNLISRDPDDFE